MTQRAKPAPGRDPKSTAAQPTPGGELWRPLKPKPKLFTALLIGFALWLGALLTLYYTTVYPLRHQPSAGAATTRPGASDFPIAPR